MNIVVITQDEPFYLPNVLPELFRGIWGKHTVTGCVLLSPSPFGKRETAYEKAIRTYKVFGARFFIYYSARYIWSLIFKRGGVEKVFRANGVEVIRLKKSINHSQSIELINKMQPDVLVSILGNEIFRAPLLQVAPCLNLHTAPLPRYRGLMPTFWVLRFKEKQTAVSVFLVDEGIDSGPIVVQKTLDIENMTQEMLIKKSKLLGMQAMCEAIDQLATNTPSLIANDETKSTYFGFPTREDVRAFRKAGARFF